ncbi:LptF/LptG family permease [Notoacmeibacter sp. MSK16QG-6]|uniref:LptF/LptG family permease n=1 Tax=Notoacmeibacter sp. MSK16QG-6 TaxID=2957982 RepID=UPI0020A0671E|nr:LptF/LptG family permease [Notoacmeibacter sp. MSK16QG-6]MCP1197976.1 LptF/LptG family permease [Notoacmeibacter sp. MSK16QG-6]
MNILNRYIAVRIAKTVLITLALSLGVVWMTEAIGRLELVTDNGSGLVFVKVASLLLPGIVPDTLPFALAIAVALTLHGMNRDSELAVIANSGGGRRQLLRPVFIVALICAAAAAYIQNVVSPASWREVRTLIAESSAELILFALQENSSRTLPGGITIQIGARDTEGQLTSILIADKRNPNDPTVIYADKAVVDKQRAEPILSLRDGQIHRGKGQDVSIINFDRYGISLYDFTGTDSKGVSFGNKEAPFSILAGLEPVQPPYRDTPDSYRKEMHVRLTSWIYCFTFAALTLAALGQPRTNRSQGMGIVPPLLVALVIRWLGFTVEDAAAGAPELIPFIYLIPIASMLVFLWIFMSGRALFGGLSMSRLTFRRKALAA